MDERFIYREPLYVGQLVKNDDIGHRVLDLLPVAVIPLRYVRVTMPEAGMNAVPVEPPNLGQSEPNTRLAFWRAAAVGRSLLRYPLAARTKVPPFLGLAFV